MSQNSEIPSVEDKNVDNDSSSHEGLENIFGQSVKVKQKLRFAMQNICVQNNHEILKHFVSNLTIVHFITDFTFQIGRNFFGSKTLE